MKLSYICKFVLHVKFYGIMGNLVKEIHDTIRRNVWMCVRINT